ncbi:MAG: hypothetical protein WCF08_09745, partial [Anaerolineaceae bacterium]
RDVFLSFGIAILPFLIYVGVMLQIQPQAFLFDLEYILTRSEGFSVLAYLPAWIINYGLLLEHDYWIFPALIGFFLIRPVRFGQFALLFFGLPLIVLARSFIIAGIGYYYVSPLLPLIALGVAAILLYGVPRVIDVSKDAITFILTRIPSKAGRTHVKPYSRVIKGFNGFVVFCLVIVPILFFYLYTLNDVMSHFHSKLDWILVDPVEARQAIDFINQNTGSEDLVIGSPAITWALKCRTADFQMTIAYDGVKTVHFPPNMPLERFAFDPSLLKAKYVVLDPVWEEFGIPAMPSVEGLSEVIISNWQMVFDIGDIQIYQNPYIQ